MGSLTDQPKAKTLKMEQCLHFVSQATMKKISVINVTFTLKWYSRLAKIKQVALKKGRRWERSASALNVYVLKCCYLCGPFVTDTGLSKRLFLAAVYCNEVFLFDVQ